MDASRPENSNPASPTAEKFEFTAEIRKLLDILVHSLYTQKEIFLRELVSNASDALDKIRFKLLFEKNLRDPDQALEIHIHLDKDQKVLTITDTGIGMTRQELIDNIGTIAHSGSLSFLKSVAQNKEKPSDFNLIGQFGVGFYSVFMVARQVEILTLPADPGSGGSLWTSDGSGQYTIIPAEKAKRGTEIKVYLKDDAGTFLEETRIKEIVRRYSDFIAYPIHLKGEKVNKLAAIWSRSSSEVQPEEYEEFFKYLTHIQETPLSHLHFSFDAPLQFRGILFIPKSVPWDIRFEVPEKWKGVHLYIKRVFIQADCEELLPTYLRFVRGIVESDDLPVNISRETLQENQVIAKIKRILTKKILEHLEGMSRDKADDYKQFWRNFSKLLKQGYRLEYENRETLANLFRFNTSRCANAEEQISLQEYLQRMPAGQQPIFYISGEDRVAIEKSPHLEIFRTKGIEVVYLTDPVDDFLFEDFREYAGKQFVCVDQEDLSLDGIESKPADNTTEAPAATSTIPKVEISDREMDDLLGFFKNSLKERVADVRFSKRLTGSPCCLVSHKDGPGLGMQKLIKMMDAKYEMPKRILELNRDHPLIQALAKIYATSPQQESLGLSCHLLLDNVLVLEGTPMDTRSMVPRIAEMMEKLATSLLPKS